MLGEQGIQNFSRQLHESWIQPELERRFGETGIPNGFQIRECRIELPKDQPAVVKFNDEIDWMFEKIELAPEVLDKKRDEWIYLHEVINPGKALPPTVNGQRVAFIYLYWAGFSYRVMFDFGPNGPDFDPQKDDFRLGTPIGEHLRLKIIEITVRAAKRLQPQLRQIGLWPVVSLLPYPISKIIERIDEGQLDEAREILAKHCNPDFIMQRLVSTWKPIRVFSEREELFQEALYSHQDGRYRAAIYTLIPQIEGVITDWLYEIVGAGVVKFRPDSKIEQFHQLLAQIPDLELMWQDALEAGIEFLSGDQLMQTFEKWLEVIDPSFPRRHAVAHGKYVEEMFNEENSIKLFLLLDTICQFMMFYEERVLGRNLSENK